MAVVVIVVEVVVVAVVVVVVVPVVCRYWISSRYFPCSFYMQES